MLQSYVRGLARETASTLRGDPQMPQEEILRRRAVCHSNACGLYVAATDACLACGCNVTKKITWRTASCPEGRWPALDPVVLPPRDVP